MNQKGFASIIIIIVAVIAIAGIGGYFVLNKQAPLPEPTPNPIENPNPTPTPIPTPKQSAQSQSPKNIPQAHNTFGFNSIKILAKEEGNKNVFISPSSIALALSMVYNGANGETKSAMQKTLQFLNFVGSYFNAEVSTLDFSNSNAANTINAWVSKNTKGKIPSIVSSPIPDG